LKDNDTSDNNDNASILFQGDMKEDDLQGPLDGKEITDLVKLMSNESAYVNILTEKNPNGEIRGQLYMGQIQLDPTGGITGLMVPGGIVKMTGVVLKNGVIIIETTRTIGFIPAPGGGSSPVDTGGVTGGVSSVVGELGGIVGKVGGTVDNTVDNVGGTVEKVGGTVDNTVQKTGNNVEQASSAVVETVDDTGNTLGNTVQKVDDGVTKILINDDDNDDDDDGDSNDSDSNDDEKDDDDGDSNDDEKDDDDGDSNDSDSNDDEKDDDDDDGGSLKDTVKKLLS
jgi:hypothetical protein